MVLEAVWLLSQVERFYLTAELKVVSAFQLNLSFIMDRIKKSADFKLVSRLGKKWISDSFIMLILKREEDSSPLRLGLTVSRKVGNAVKRNRVKRRFRALMRLYAPQDELSGFDIVLIGRTAAIEKDFLLMKKDLLWCFKRLELIK